MSVIKCVSLGEITYTFHIHFYIFLIIIILRKPLLLFLSLIFLLSLQSLFRFVTTYYNTLFFIFLFSSTEFFCWSQRSLSTLQTFNQTKQKQNTNKLILHIYTNLTYLSPSLSRCIFNLQQKTKKKNFNSPKLTIRPITNHNH